MYHAIKKLTQFLLLHVPDTTLKSLKLMTLQHLTVDTNVNKYGSRN